MSVSKWLVSNGYMEFAEYFNMNYYSFYLTFQ